jgi:RHS repeat-associated protein
MGDDLADLFNMKLMYDAPTAVTAQYNGNISEMQWRTFNPTGSVCGQLNAYRLSYDKGNRLLNANHWTQTGAVWANTDNYSENNISYDLNGNIKTLNRRGLISETSFGQIDQLSYVYNVSNMNQAINNADKLLQVTDNALLANQSKGFKPITGAANYEYDANGNMTKDNNKTVTITYNHLNLPTTFTVNGSLITMTYTADGEKLAKVAGANTKNYVSGIEYKGAALEAIYTSEGRCTPNGATAFFYEYTIKDHLGNARVSFRANGAAVSVIQENHYYAFGMEMEGAWAAQTGTKNNYEYNGKELNEDFGLNLSDYGARWYDAAVGRWWSVDPLAEKTLSRSSYCYGLNNPIRMIDPNGMEATTNSPEFAVIINNAWNATKHGTDMHFEVKGNWEKKEEKGKDYVFNQKGDYLRSESGGKQNQLVVENSETCAQTKYQFNDPENDGKAIENGKITRFEIMSSSKFNKMIEQSGVKTDAARKSPLTYAKKQGVGGGLMDYGANACYSGEMSSNTFYMLDNIAYNIGDMGNYMFGYGAGELGLDYASVWLGSNGNNAVNGRKDKFPCYDFGVGTYGEPGFWDSPSDQAAISRGFSNSPYSKSKFDQQTNEFLKYEKLGPKY